MPKIDEKLRRQWDDYQRRSKEFWERIEARYHRKSKRHTECRICGEMITVIEPADIFEALARHERSHPEYAEWVALSKEFPLADLSKVLHDHDCVFVKCSCICGCRSNICVAGLSEAERDSPMLCDSCMLYEGRENQEHQLPSQTAHRRMDYGAGLKEIAMMALESIVEEPEYPGDMPQELWDTATNMLSGNKHLLAEVLRNSVRLTKSRIRQRLLSKFADKGLEIDGAKEDGCTE